MTEVRQTKLETELGELTLVATGDAVSGLYFPGHWTRPDQTSFGPEVAPGNDRLLIQAEAEINSYLSGNRTDFTVPVVTDGDEFQERVWALLKEIPYGELTTYGDIAAQVGNPNLARRVGGAVGSNPISILIPCHRVVGSDRSLTGYAGGIERKRHLLEIETPSAEEAGRLF